MTGPTDGKARRRKAASSSPPPVSPSATDDYIYDMLERLCPDETVVRRPRPGNLP